MIDGPSAIDLSCIHGLNLKPSVCISESDLTPGYLKIPCTTNTFLPSRIEKDLFGQDFFMLYPAAIPDIPAPTIITSLCMININNL